LEYLMKNLAASDMYRVMTSCIVPRPIAWVSTVSADGISNIAPFSFFTGVSIEPPLVVFAVERRNGMKKDTVINIEETKQFVINLVTEYNVEQMNLTSQDYASEEDEIRAAGLTAIPSKLVVPPSILESPIHLECQLDHIVEIGSSPHSLVIGEVVRISVDDAIMDGERISMDRLPAVGRMGGKWYVKTGQLFELPRLDWRKNEIG
jgi:flavin reductase (DIM6/NTAB) family NADH-FMN oxidoreductase RutF